MQEERYVISECDGIAKLLLALHRNTKGEHVRNWADISKISDADVAELRRVLGMREMAKIRTLSERFPFPENCMTFLGEKEAYPGGSTVVITEVVYDPETKTAFYTELWPYG